MKSNLQQLSVCQVKEEMKGTKKKEKTEKTELSFPPPLQLTESLQAYGL